MVNLIAEKMNSKQPNPEQLAEASRRVAQAVKQTLKVFRYKSATPAERAASLEMEKRLLGSHLVDTEMGLQARKNVDSDAASDREISDPGELEGKPKSNRASQN